jgi:hypothetical protein
MSPVASDAAGGDLFAANLTGSLLAVASSAFIGVSFIVKKKGLRRAGAAGTRAGFSDPSLSPVPEDAVLALLAVSPSLEYSARRALGRSRSCFLGANSNPICREM